MSASAEPAQHSHGLGHRLSWHDPGFAGLVTLAALLPRLFVAIAWTAEPVWDGHYYHFGATRIAEGLGYSEDVVIDGVPIWKPWCHYPVGYSAFLGGLYKLFGTGLLVAPVANALLGALTVLLAHQITSFATSRWRARIAATLVAMHPGLILYTGVVMNELLSACSALIPLWLVLALRVERRWTFAIAGVSIGLAALVRPLPALVGVPLLGFAFAGEVGRLGRRLLDKLKATLVIGAATLAAILPWTLRNCAVMDGCALISTNGGWNLAIGALTQSGRFHTLTADDGCRVVTGQVQQDRCWAEIGREAIARDPGRWFGLMDDKWRHTYNHESFAVGYLREANPQAWPEPRRELAQTALTGFHHLILAIASFSVVAWPLRRRDLGRGRWLATLKQPARFAQLLLAGAVAAFVVHGVADPYHPLFWLAVVLPLLAMVPLPGAPRQGPVNIYHFGMIFGTTLTHGIFFGDDRYHLVVSPMLCLLAANALRPPSSHPTSETAP